MNKVLIAAGAKDGCSPLGFPPHQEVSQMATVGLDAPSTSAAPESPLNKSSRGLFERLSLEEQPHLVKQRV